LEMAQCFELPYQRRERRRSRHREWHLWN
jgi:hypothetical protein